jgi:ATP-dependent DNA helicase RecG
MGLCEERGGGLDKAALEIEHMQLPAADITSSEHSFKVVLFGKKAFSELSKQERQRACFVHCVLGWVTQDFMSNASLRRRFSLPDEDYQSVSTVISEAVRANRIVPADPNQGNRYARYLPYWAGSASQ